jgi:hypothetical protein
MKPQNPEPEEVDEEKVDLAERLHERYVNGE